MQALVYTGPGVLEVLDTQKPEPREDEVLVRVIAAGICGSELEGIASRDPFRVPPIIMGHEFYGRRVKDGAPVVINPLISCGECDLCRRGRLEVCRRRVIVGIQRPGAFAEFVCVPSSAAHPAPPDLPPKLGAFVEPLANAVHALELATHHDSELAHLGIVGAGAIGTAMLIAAKARGIDSVSVADPAETRLAIAKQLGADTVGPTLSGEFDAVVDTVGTRLTRANAVELTQPGGCAVWVGLHDAATEIDGKAMIRQQKAVLASFGYTTSEFDTALSVAAAQGKSDWIDEFPLQDGASVFQRLLRGPSAAIRTVLTP